MRGHRLTPVSGWAKFRPQSLRIAFPPFRESPRAFEPATRYASGDGPRWISFKITMRSIIDWLSELHTAKRNSYLRLSHDDRLKFGVRFVTFWIAVGLLFVMWHLLRG
jgi:hypothetical protein